MGRPNKKGGETKSAYLSQEAINKSKILMNRRDISFSDLVELCIMNFNEKIDYESEIFKTQQELIEIDEKRQKVIDKEKNLRELWTKNLSWQNQLISKKQDAIKIIINKLSNNQVLEAENVARTWEKMIHVPHEELLAEATNKLYKGI